jgi:hypothetical protein
MLEVTVACAMYSQGVLFFFCPNRSSWSADRMDGPVTSYGE